MSAWSCPHDVDGVCQRVNGARCDPGMRGCELEGKVRFANEAMNVRRKPSRAETRRPSPVAAPKRRLPF